MPARTLSGDRSVEDVAQESARESAPESTVVAHRGRSRLTGAAVARHRIAVRGLSRPAD